MNNKSEIEYNYLYKRRQEIIICLFLVAATLAVYWQIINHEFINYDDETYITKNLHVQTGLTSESIKWAFTSFHAGNWHPVTWLSHMLDIELFGLDPMRHHWTSLQIHVINTLLLFSILQYMTGAILKSAFVAALFALHPLHVESVAWVSERKDVLSAFFGMLTILAYIIYVKKGNLFSYFLVFIFLSLGLMAKPMLATLPFVLLLLDFWPLERLKSCSHHQSSKSFSLIYEKIPLFVPVLISSVLTILAQNEAESLYTFEALPLQARIANAFVSYTSYIVKTVWPHNLAVFYPHPLGISSLWHVFLAAFAIAGISFFSIRLLKQYPYVAVGWSWYLGTLIPVIGLVQVGTQSMADRYTYIPLTGLFMVIAWGIPDILQKWRWPYSRIILAISSIMIIFAFSTRSYCQVRHWENSITVFRNAVKVTDNNWLAYNNLGLALMRDGRSNDAVSYFKKTLQIKPDFLKTVDNLGVALFQLGRFEEALSCYTKALMTNSENAKIHKRIAMILETQGRLKKAVQHYTKALLIDPELADVHYGLANALAAQKDFEKAKYQYREAIKEDSGHSNAHYNLGCILLKQKKHKEALTSFTEVIKIDPDYKQAYNQIGVILLQRGKIDKAEKFFAKSIQIDPGYKEATDNLLVLEQMAQQDEQ